MTTYEGRTYVISSKKLFIINLFVVVLAGILVYGYLTLHGTQKTARGLAETLVSTQTKLSDAEKKIADDTQTLDTLTKESALAKENTEELVRLLAEERDRNDAFEKQIGKISGTVGKLDQLSKLDPELLIKYSKVYFLNENYIPEKLKEIDSEFQSNKDGPETINAKVAPFLTNLLNDAKDDGVHLLVLSGFRSFDTQMKLKSSYTMQYGSGANAFSADQGYSEHQLGTAVDFTTLETNGALTGFDTTAGYAWLEKNAYKYGFILSYPKGGLYYIFEPWHWRFVGRDLARDLHSDNKFFYDLEQREIDKYLINIFD